MPAAGQASARPLAICAAWYRALQVQPGVPGVSASVPGPPAGCMPSVGLAVRRSGCGGKSMVVACPQLSNSGTPHTVPWSRRPRVVTEATCEQVWPGPAAQGRWLGEDEGWTGRSQGPSVHSSAHQASVCVCVYMCAVSLHAHTCTHMLDTQCTHMYVLCTCMCMCGWSAVHTACTQRMQPGSRPCWVPAGRVPCAGFWATMVSDALGLQ